jgi:hypothetical protein
MSTNVEFHRLTFVPERDDVMVGRPDIDSYAVFPPDGVALLQRLAGGCTPVEAAAWYEASYGQPIDVEDFLATLQDLGFVREADDFAAEDQASAAHVRFQRLGRAAFSLMAALCYAGLALSCAYLIVIRPELRPRPQNVFFTSSLILVQVAVFVGQIGGIAWHETFHVLAGRRLGIPSRIRVGRRLYFVVVETALDGLLSVTRGRRYLPFLAGMLADVILFSGLTLAAAATATRGGPLAWTGRLAWQFYLFLRTDLYYVFATLLGCSDLHDASRAYLRNRLWALAGRPERMVDEDTWSARDRSMARWYAPLAILGALALTTVTVVGVLPIVGQCLVRVVHGVATSRGATPRFWDAVVFVAFTGVQVGLLIAVSFIPWIRGRRRPARDRATVSPSMKGAPS